MGSIIGHRIDYNGVGVLRGQGHMLVKINPSTSNTSTQLLENTCVRDSHKQENKDLTEQFTILKKCRGKFECLIYEVLFIQEKKPKLNTQSDSIKAKLFST